jgi:trk system potassium uptake protein TrkA
MDIIICGAGQVGRSIAQQLSRENNSVTVIDKDPMIIAEINNSLDVKGVVGYASHPSVLEMANASDCDMLIAVTHSDEVNMVACQVAHALFNVPVKVARVRHPDYLEPAWQELYSHQHLPIDVIISPEMVVAAAIMRRLHIPGALDSVPFAEGNIQMLGIKCESGAHLSNLPIKIVQERLHKHQIALLGIAQHGKFLLPNANGMLHEQDVIYCVMTKDKVTKLLGLCGHHEQEARRLIILGGGNIGLTIAETIEEEGKAVNMKLIELNRERCEYIYSVLDSNTTIVNGSGLNKDILHECDIDTAEAFVAVTNDDKVNILASLLAKKLGCKRTITLVNTNSYIPMLENLGIDVLVNPRETTVSTILRYIRRGKISGVYSLMDGAAEIIEAEVDTKSKLLGKVIGHLSLPKNMHLAAIWRDNQLVIPQPHDILHEKDHVIMIGMSDVVKQMEQYFAATSQHF